MFEMFENNFEYVIDSRVRSQKVQEKMKFEYSSLSR